MTAPVWIAWTIVIPILGAMVTYAFGRRAASVAVVVALGTLGAVVGLVHQVVGSGQVRHEIGGWHVPLGIALHADGIAVLLLAVVAVVGVATTAYALAHFTASEGGSPRNFFPLWCLTWGGLNALLVSGDIFNMYVALELTTLAAVALLGGSGNRAAPSAALHYLLFAMAGSLAYLTGVVVLYGALSVLDVELLGERTGSGTAVGVALSFMAVGLSLKSALFPFHAWLPPAYASATAPVSVVLSALVSKAAFYLLLRVWMDVFPAVAARATGQFLGILGGVGVVWGSVLAMRQRRLSMLLAYSSVAQIGYFFLLFPLGTQRALRGGLYLVVSHAVAKASMFMAVGTIRRAVGHDDLDGVQGLAHRLPFTFFSLALAGMSLMGMPPSGGFIGKWLIARAAFEVGEWVWAVVALGGGLLTAAYVFRMLRESLLPLPGGVVLRPTARSAEWVSLMLAILAVGLGVMPWLPLSLIEPRGGP